MAKIGRRSTLHDFRDNDGGIIQYTVLIAATGLTQGALQNRLRCYDEPPTDLRAFLKVCLEFPKQSDFENAISGAEFTSEIEDVRESKSTRAQLDELKIAIDKEKLREIRFKNEREEGKWGLIDDFQRKMNEILIQLKTNLYGLPDQVLDSIMSSRDRNDAKEVLFDALEHHMRLFSTQEIDLDS